MSEPQKCTVLQHSVLEAHCARACLHVGVAATQAPFVHTALQQSPALVQAWLTAPQLDAQRASTQNGVAAQHAALEAQLDPEAPQVGFAVQTPLTQLPEQQLPVPHEAPIGTQADTASQLVPVQVRPPQQSAVEQLWPDSAHGGRVCESTHLPSAHERRAQHSPRPAPQPSPVPLHEVSNSQTPPVQVSEQHSFAAAQASPPNLHEKSSTQVP